MKNWENHIDILIYLSRSCYLSLLKTKPLSSTAYKRITSEIIIDLEAILKGLQQRQKLQCLYGISMANNSFKKTKFWKIYDERKVQIPDKRSRYLTKFGGYKCKAFSYVFL